MADKKITDLSLRSDFDETVNLPGDDTSQTWRVTGAQIATFVEAELGISPIGGAGARYRSDGTDPAWGFDVQDSSTTTDTMAANEDFHSCDATAGAYTLTLPTVVNGKIIRIRKTDSTFNRVTLGAITSLNTQNEMAVLMGISGSWVVIDRHIPSVVTSFVPTIYGSTTNPTRMVGYTEYAYWGRSGEYLDYHYTLANGSSGGAAGSGTYIWSLPSGLTPNSTKISTDASVIQAGVCGASSFRGSAASSEVHGACRIVDGGSSKIGIQIQGILESTGVNTIGNSTSMPLNAGCYVSFSARVPITEWA
jgi:hypothetical protein